MADFPSDMVVVNPPVSGNFPADMQAVGSSGPSPSPPDMQPAAGNPTPQLAQEMLHHLALRHAAFPNMAQDQANALAQAAWRQRQATGEQNQSEFMAQQPGFFHSLGANALASVTPLAGALEHQLAGKVGDISPALAQPMENAAQAMSDYQPPATAGSAGVAGSVAGQMVGGSAPLLAGPAAPILAGLQAAAPIVNQAVATEQAGGQVDAGQVLRQAGVTGVENAAMFAAPGLVPKAAQAIGRAVPAVGRVLNYDLGQLMHVPGAGPSVLEQPRLDQASREEGTLMPGEGRTEAKPTVESGPEAPQRPPPQPVPPAAVPPDLQPVGNAVHPGKPSLMYYANQGQATALEQQNQMIRNQLVKMEQLHQRMQSTLAKYAPQSENQITLPEHPPLPREGVRPTNAIPELTAEQINQKIKAQNTGELDEEATRQYELGDKDYELKDVPKTVPHDEMAPGSNLPMAAQETNAPTIPGERPAIVPAAEGGVARENVPATPPGATKAAPEVIAGEKENALLSARRAVAVPKGEEGTVEKSTSAKAADVASNTPSGTPGTTPGNDEKENALLSARRRAGQVTLPTGEEVGGGLKSVVRKAVNIAHTNPVREIGSWLGTDVGLDKTGRRVANDIRGLYGRQELASARIADTYRDVIDKASGKSQDEQAALIQHIESHGGHSSDPDFADWAEQHHEFNQVNRTRMEALKSRGALGQNINTANLMEDWVGRDFEFPDQAGRFPGDMGYKPGEGLANSALARRSLAGSEATIKSRTFDNLEDSIKAVRELGGRPVERNLFKMAQNKDQALSDNLTAREYLADAIDRGDARITNADAPLAHDEKVVDDKVGRLAWRKMSVPGKYADRLNNSQVPLMQRVGLYRDLERSGEMQEVKDSQPTYKEARGEEQPQTDKFSKSLTPGHVLVDDALVHEADTNRKVVARAPIADLMNHVASQGSTSSVTQGLAKLNRAGVGLQMLGNLSHALRETMGSSALGMGQAAKDIFTRGRVLSGGREFLESIPGVNVASAALRNASIKESLTHGPTGEAAARGGMLWSLNPEHANWNDEEFADMRDAFHQGRTLTGLRNLAKGTVGQISKGMFNKFIPMMQRWVTAMKADSELKSKPNMTDEEFNQVMSEHAKDMSNVLGVKDNRIHFQNKTAEHVSNLMYGFANWKLGKLRSVVGGVAGAFRPLTGRNLSPATFTLLGGIASMAMTGTAIYAMSHHGELPDSYDKIKHPFQGSGLGGKTSDLIARLGLGSSKGLEAWELPDPWEAVEHVVMGDGNPKHDLSDRAVRYITGSVSPIVDIADAFQKGGTEVGSSQTSKSAKFWKDVKTGLEEAGWPWIAKPDSEPRKQAYHQTGAGAYHQTGAGAYHPRGESE